MKNCEACGAIETAERVTLGVNFEADLCAECVRAYLTEVSASGPDHPLEREWSCDAAYRAAVSRQCCTGDDLSEIIERRRALLSEARRACFLDASRWMDARRARIGGGG